MVTIPIKSGDTFPLSCAYTVDGNAAALPPGIRSQIRARDGSLVAELDVSIVDPAGGLYTLTCADTSTWPIDVLRGDIQYTDASGNVASTDTFLVSVIPDVTHD